MDTNGGIIRNAPSVTANNEMPGLIFSSARYLRASLLI